MSKAGLAKTVGGAGLALAGILGAVYAHEGGYVNDPADPGGETNYGVTAKTARAHGYKGDMRLFPKHCVGGVKVCADAVYIKSYVKPMTGGEEMPLITIDPAVSNELANTAVNMGLLRPSRWFQASLRDFGYPVAVDGKIGPQTIFYALKYRQATGWQGCQFMLDSLDAKQRAEYDRIVRVRPASRKFYKGWIRLRINNVNRAECGWGL